MSNRNKRKGRAKFVMIDGYVWRTAAWQALSNDDKGVYLELKWRYDGVNNGRIGLGEREAAAALRIGRDTVRRSFTSLSEKGFVAKAKPSGFNVKNRAATEWRLTEYKCDVTGELPTKEFARWSPEKSTGAPQVHTGAPQVHPHPEKEVKYG